MSADSQFLQSKTATNFINNGISWPTFLAANLPAGGPAYPLPDPGVRIRIKPRDDLAFQAAVFSGDPSGGDGSNQNLPLPTGTVFSFRSGAFFIAEASYLPTRARTPRGFRGLQDRCLVHTSPRFGDQRYDNTGLSLASRCHRHSLQHTGDTGVYGVIDQMLYRVRRDDQGLSAFFRAGGRTIATISFCADGGLLYRPRAAPAGRQGGDRRRLCARGEQCARARYGHRFLRKLLLSGAERRNHDRDDLSGAAGAVVDASAGNAIYHPSRRRRSQQRREHPTECVGSRVRSSLSF
jgi:hypothetical protein